ncbi:MAG TPA: hypothetical protein PKM41_01005 [Deltaproteobacteria bacterium]|nr:hypothetical protein [Deltaproteobacteria bacterium]HOI06659.1 hypothetical protein [Deltaproteobacteria bacterium]
MTKTTEEVFWKLFARLPYALLILSLLCLSVLTIVRAAGLCDIRTLGPQVIISRSLYFYLGVFLLAFTVALAGWFLRQLGVRNCDKIIILGLLIPAVPFVAGTERVVVDPEYVAIEKGTRFSPTVQRLDIRDIDGISVAYRKVPGGSGRMGYVFTWKSKSGTTGSAPLSAEMTTALPMILTVMELHSVPYLGDQHPCALPSDRL